MMNEFIEDIDTRDDTVPVPAVDRKTAPVQETWEDLWRRGVTHQRPPG